MPQRPFLIILTPLLLMLVLPVNSTRGESLPAKPQWDPKQFPISFWCGPPAEFVTPERFQEIADAGFTHAMPPCMGHSADYNKRALECAKAAGIEVFLRDARMPGAVGTDGAGKEAIDQIVADYANHPAFAGYFIGDEPSAGAFPALGTVVKYLREKDPAHPAYLNLYPNYCPPHGLGTPTYEAYLEAFMTQVKPTILSYDHYHFLSKSDRPGFFSNLAAVRAAAQRHNVPFWQIVLLINHFDYRTLTDGELRWEAMQTLAYGGKGLMWFTYWTPDTNDIWGEAMVTLDGRLTQKYEQVKRVNRAVKAIGQHLLDASSIRVIEFGMPGDLTNTGGDQPFTVKGPNLTIGYFSVSKDVNERLALIANRDYKNDASAEVTIDTQGAPIERLDKESGQWEKADLNESGALRVKLIAGDADLYRWSLPTTKPSTAAGS